jgi:hypothetical protein
MTSEDVWIASLDAPVIEAHALVRQPDNSFATVCGMVVDGGHIFVGSRAEVIAMIDRACSGCLPVMVVA